MKLFVTGINHHNVPLPLREKYVLSSSDIRSLLPEIRSCPPVVELVVLSTCNRVEFYAVAPRLTYNSQEVFGHILRMAWPDMPAGDFDELRQASYLHQDAACVHHLFRVASSLDSLVVGETEITGQVKAAYHHALEHGATGRILNRLFQGAFSAAKKARTETGIGDGSVSIGALVAQAAAEAFGGELCKKKVLVVGAGDMGRKVLNHLAGRTCLQDIWIANRSREKARTVAEPHGAHVLDLHQAREVLPLVDLIVTSAQVKSPLFTAGDIAAARQDRSHRPLLIIDLAVPRNVDPGASATEGVRLINFDALGHAAERNRARRYAAAALCEHIVSGAAQRFSSGLLPAVQPAGTVHATMAGPPV